MKRHYDIIVIGSGAGGATFARALSDTGKSILILERGPQLPIEPDNWSSKVVYIDKKYRTGERWLDKKGREFRPNTHYWLGGNTSFYGAALMRMKRRDFEAVNHAGGGVSPAWPIAYDDMRPWYGEAEKRWEVHGTRGVDPFDEPGDPPFPYPALTHDPGIARLKDHFESLGWRPSPLPIGVRRNDATPALGACIRCATCGGYPCLLRAKVDARTAELLHLWRAPNVTIMTDAKATKIETSADGRRATGVVVEMDGGEERFQADIIVAAAGAVNTAALFLASASSAHPNGLANGSDQVGRNYMFHMTSAVLSLAIEKFDASFPKTLCVNDFYFGEPDEGFPYPMGQIQLLEFMSGDTLQGEISDWVPPALLPDAFANALADRMVSFLAMSEDLPSPENRVTLTANGRIRLSYTWGDTSAHERLVKKLEKGLCGFAAHTHSLLEHRFEVDSILPLFGTAHQCGTLRFGADPKSSVLDVNCKAHELDNLYAVDSSFFPSSSAVNPTLTIVANALRVAAHLRERLV
ncbi:MAG TPA: GMC family oxidoreductase [Parvularculaceae bacterium]|nr:GMC family oxidoreductase [Parvularculaceae bacterium]